MRNHRFIPLDITMDRYIIDLLESVSKTCDIDRSLDIEEYVRSQLSRTFSDTDYHVVVTDYREIHPLTDLTYTGLQLTVSILYGTLYDYTFQVVRLHPEDHYRLSEHTKKLLVFLKYKCTNKSSQLLGDYVSPDKVWCSKLR